MTQPFTPLQAAIIAALNKGDRNQGELLDETGCSSYPELNVALKTLTGRGLITYRFTETSPPVMIFSLKPSPIPAWLQRR